MKPILEWLLNVCAGLLLGTQAMRVLKVVNEESDSPIAVGMQSSAVRGEFEAPYIMGSEQINAALQQILSSDENGLRGPSLFIGAEHNVRSECTLGSESLNRMLEDMLAQSSNGNHKMPHIEPAIQL